MSGDVVLEQCVKLTGHLVWPLAVLILVVVLRKEIRGFVETLRKKVGSAEGVKMTTSGIELQEHVAALEARTDSHQIVQDDIIQLIRGNQSSSVLPGGPAAEQAQSPDTVAALADLYDNLAVADWQARVATKTELARRIALAIVVQDMDRRELAERDSNGVRAGLAGAIHFAPRPGDLQLLDKLSARADGRHVPYKVVAALGRLAETGNVSEEEIPVVDRIFCRAASEASPELKTRIREVSALVNYTFSVRKSPGDS